MVTFWLTEQFLFFFCNKWGHAKIIQMVYNSWEKTWKWCQGMSIQIPQGVITETAQGLRCKCCANLGGKCAITQKCATFHRMRFERSRDDWGTSASTSSLHVEDESGHITGRLNDMFLQLLLFLKLLADACKHQAGGGGERRRCTHVTTFVFPLRNVGMLEPHRSGVVLPFYFAVKKKKMYEMFDFIGKDKKFL